MSKFACLLSCLRREMRAHAWILPASAGLVPLLGCALASLPKAAPAREIVVACSTLATALFLGSQALACELRDEQSQGIAVLRRLPAGLGVAITAKLLVVACGTLACFAIAHALGSVFALHELDASWRGWTVCTALALGATSLATSTWIPRASLALPTAMLAGLVVASPSVIAWQGNPWTRPSALGVSWISGICLPLLGIATVVATTWLLRRERSELRVGIGGACAFLLASLPAAAAQTVSLEDRVRTDSRDFTVDRAFLSRSGRVAWLTCRNKRHSAGNYLLRVDLETRKVHEYPRRMQRFELPGDARSATGRTSLVVLRELADESSAGVTLDAETGEERANNGCEAIRRTIGSVGQEEISLHEGRLYGLRRVAGLASPEYRIVFPFDKELAR